MKDNFEELYKVNREMKESTKKIKQDVIEMTDKSSLKFGVIGMEKMLNMLNADNAENITDSTVSKYLSAEDYKKLVLAEIDIIQAYENLQATYIDVIKTAKENYDNDDFADESITKFSDILATIINECEEE